MLKKLKGDGSIFLILLGIPFFIFGSLSFIVGFIMLVDTINATDWEKVPTNIQKLNIKDSDEGSYFAETLYQYSYNGKHYEGTVFTFDKNSNEKKAIKALQAGVKSKRTSYCFVNPDNPSESVLLKRLPQTVNIFIPIGICFLLVGVGLIGGTIQQSIHTRKTADLFQRTGIITYDKITSGGALIMIPLATGFVLTCINALIISSNWLGSANIFLITLGAMGLSFYAGWKWSRRYKTITELQIITFPAWNREFKFSLQFKSNDSDEQFTNISLNAALTVYYYDEWTEDEKRKTLLSVPFKEGGRDGRKHYFIIDSDKINPDHIPHPDENIPQLLERFSLNIKNTDRYREYLKHYENARNIATVLKGGQDVEKAAKEIYSAHVDIKVTGDFEQTFDLPPEFWNRVESGNF
jgi:hypothetical protein